MADLKTTLKLMKEIPGNVGAALVDIEMGICLAQTAMHDPKTGARSFELDTLTELYAHYVRHKTNVLKRMQIDEPIEELVVTTKNRYHLVYPLQIQVAKNRKPENVFFFLSLVRDEITLSQAQRKSKEIIEDFALKYLPASSK